MKEITFKNLPIGPFGELELEKVWGDVKGITGLKEGRASIVDVDGESVLQIIHPKGKIGTNVKWSEIFVNSHNEFTLEYKVRFPSDFDFVRGGKFPGLYGGSGPEGGASVKEADGFSCRVMWRELGLLVQYVYYMDKLNKSWGEDFIWMNGANKNVSITNDMWKTVNEHFDDRMYLTPNKWHTLKTYIKMNTPGIKDGKIISWLDGKEAVNIDIAFRNDKTFGIDRVKFTNFFGGNDDTWAPRKDEAIYFKDFKFSPTKF